LELRHMGGIILVRRSQPSHKIKAKFTIALIYSEII
jgi:hypothetical protein